MRKLRAWLSGWAALLSIMLASRDASQAVRDAQYWPQPGQDPADAAWALIADWREKSRAKRRYANLLGDCMAGRETFTEATVLSACADEAERALAPRQPGPGQETGHE